MVLVKRFDPRATLEQEEKAHMRVMKVALTAKGNHSMKWEGAIMKYICSVSPPPSSNKDAEGAWRAALDPRREGHRQRDAQQRSESSSFEEDK